MKNWKTSFIKPFRNFLPLKPYFIQNRLRLALGLASLLLVDFLQLLIPLVIKKAVDLIAEDGVSAHSLLQQAGLILLIALSIVFLRYVWRLLIFGHSRRVEEDLRNRLYGHLQTLSQSFYQRMKTGDIMARAINDLNAVRMATGMGLVALVDGIVLGIAAVGFMISIDLRLTLISLIPAPIVIISSRILTRRMSAGFETVQATFSDLTERVREAFAGIRVIKAYHRESWQYERVKKQGEQYISVNMDLTKTLALFLPMMAVFTNLGLAVVIWLGGSLTISGDITIGDFVAFTAYLNLLTWPMMAMGWVANLLQRGSASMGRINRIFDETPEIKGPEIPRPISSIHGEIEFRGLSVRHPPQKNHALKDIHFRVAQGETIAVVGGVGSGKTTLLQLIPRLVEAESGTLLIDGHDIRDISLETLRKNIGFVPQEPFVFSDTIRNNILFGVDHVSQQDLAAVMQDTHLFEEIQALEKGLETVLGERGITLSGGQRQRLTIARALIIDPPVLILDDSLSMVDTRTEAHILNRIIKTRQNKTNLIVSHRVSTISRANRIAVLDDGRLMEQGSHDELLALKGTYARLYQRQQLALDLE